MRDALVNPESTYFTALALAIWSLGRWLVREGEGLSHDEASRGGQFTRTCASQRRWRGVSLDIYRDQMYPSCCILLLCEVFVHILCARDACMSWRLARLRSTAT